MQNHTLEVTADNQPTALERLLQVTRYRGFLVTDLSVATSNHEQHLEIKMSVNQPSVDPLLDQNGIQRLYNQLNKLFDIKHVNLIENKLAKRQAC
ncbi:MAG: acetolactate synthase 2 small subunit [Kangiellaceae bacterium]|jgi:acetolactate synthase II small subunit